MVVAEAKVGDELIRPRRRRLARRYKVLMPAPRIHCLLPPKEVFSASGAGAQALKIIQTSRHSRHRDNITVFGIPTPDPYKDVAFQPLRQVLPALFGQNMSLVRAYARHVGNDPPDLIECFNRPHMALWLAKRYPRTPVTVYFGNDPQKVNGSRQLSQRHALVKCLAGIYFISEYLFGQYMAGLGETPPPNVRMLRTGIERHAQTQPEKEPIIVFVGRVKPIKGVLELTQALARVLPRNESWQAYLIGAQWFGSGKAPSPYEDAVRDAASACDRIQFLGFRPNEEVVQLLRRAAISVVPSNWDEPFGRTALESLAEGCAVICSKRGGLAELGHRARFLKNVSADEIEAALQDVISNDALRASMLQTAWNDFPFTMSSFVKQWDDYRDGHINRDG